jgi:hypothetical protein
MRETARAWKQQPETHQPFHENFTAGRNSANARQFVVAGKISRCARWDSKTKGSAMAGPSKLGASNRGSSGWIELSYQFVAGNFQATPVKSKSFHCTPC